MGYLLYLAGLAVCIWWGIGSDKIGNFIDMVSLRFVVLPCILVVVCAGYGRDFIRAFMCLFKKEAFAKEEIRSSAKAVKLVCISSLIFGGLGVVISLINALKSLDLSALYPEIVAFDLSVALISGFYALVINAVLAPLYFVVKHSDIQRKVKEKTASEKRDENMDDR